MLDKKHIKHFETLVGKENVYSDKAHLIAYSYDATRTRFEPEAVVFPRDEADVSAILSYCNEHDIVITPRGALRLPCFPCQSLRFCSYAFPYQG